MIYFYIGCLTFGFVYALISLILGTHGIDHGIDAHGVDLDSNMAGHGVHATGEIHASNGEVQADSKNGGASVLNPIVLASGLAAFGAGGIVGDTGLGFGPFQSLIVALMTALIIGSAVFYGVVKVIYKSQSDSNFSDEELIDEEAEVFVPIPVKGMGEIVFTAGGSRTSLAAKSNDGEAMPRGSKVYIRRIENRIAYVASKVIIDDYIIEEEKKSNENRREIK